MISVVRVTADETSALRDLMADYLVEMGEILGGRPLDGYPFFDQYWLEPHARWPYWIRVNGRAAGFALVRRNPDDGRFEIAEFYVAPDYRRGGVGIAAAQAVIDRHRGDWRVTQRLANKPALAFWDRVLSGYPKSPIAPISRESIRREQLFSTT